jgi:hypothetical protein
MTFAAQGFGGCPGSSGGSFHAALAFSIGRGGTFEGFFRHLAFAGRSQLHPSAARFGKPNRNSLLGGTSAVFAFAYMVHFFANELAGLRGRRLALFLVLPSAF